MKATRELPILACLLALGLAGVGQAVAQDKPEPEKKPEAAEPAKKAEDDKPPEPPDPYSEKVTVTATRVETDLMKTPIAVTVVDQEELDRQGVHNVADMAQMVPNMDIATKNGQSTPIISMRGVRSTNETELGDPSVGVHLDGIYSPRMQGILGLMFDNERVEILRGPQGTLFGRNSTVGSINIVSAKPKFDKFDSKISLQYGNFNAPEVSGMVNYPVSDTFAVRFAGRVHKRDSHLDGYWDPNQYDQRYIAGIVADAPVIAPGSFEECTSPACQTRTQHSNWWIDTVQPERDVRALVPADKSDFYGNSEEWAYRFSGLWQPEFKDITLGFSVQHYRSDSAGGIDQVNCEKLRGRPTYLNDGARHQLVVTGVNDCSTLFPNDDTYQAVVNVPGRFFLDIKYLRSHLNWDLTNNLRLVYLGGFEDQSRESAQDMEQSLNAWDQALFFLPGTGSQSWSQEVQLQSYGDKAFNWIAGVNFFEETTHTIGFFDNAIDEKALWNQPDRSTAAGALFAQGTYSLTDKWHLTLGGRYSDETKRDKGGRSYICNVANGCGSPVLRETVVNAGQTGFSREDLNALPENFFANPAVYTDDNGTPNDPSDDFQVFTGNDNRGSWNHTDWRVGLDYQKNDNTLWYAYLATGFKAGGIGDVFEGTVTDGEIDENGDGYIVSMENLILRTAYDPEEVTTLELGFKQRFFDGKLDLKGAYFYSDYEDMQYASVGSLAYTERWGILLDPSGEPYDVDGNPGPDFGWVGSPLVTAYYTQNVPGAEIQGFELEYDWRPWRAGRLYGYASWLDAKITEDWITKWDYDPVSYFGIDFAQAANAANSRLQVNLKGNNLAVSPPIKLHLTADHAFLLAKHKMSIVPWVTAHWEDDSYLTIWNVDRHTDLDFVIQDQDIRFTDDKRKAWSMLHTGVRLYSGDLTAEIYAYNLTDEVVQWWGGAAEQVPRGSMSMPRTYGVRFGYHF